MSTAIISEDTIAQTRAEHAKVPKTSGDRFAVIVKNSWLGLGVQYWTAEEIGKGVRKNTDRSTCTFIEKL